MSYTAFAPFVPATYSFFLLLSQLSPKTFATKESQVESHLTDRVKSILKNIFVKESSSGAEHHERIEDMLDCLEDIGVEKEKRTIETYLEKRIKVIDTNGPVAAVSGTDYGSCKYYLQIDPKCDKIVPYLVTHEASHILNEDVLENLALRSAITFASAMVLTFSGVNVHPLSSLLVTTAVDFISHSILSRKVESKADDFAIKHCTREELEYGVEFYNRFEKVLEHPSSQTSKLWQKLQYLFKYPSVESRRHKIQLALENNKTTQQVAIA